jgi:iron complex transport system permease protein
VIKRQVHWLPFVALTGGAISTLLLLVLAKDMLNRPAAFALISIALAAVFSAGIDFFLVSFPLEINTSMVWLTGSVWGRNWSHIPPLILWLFVLMPFAIYLAYKLDILGLGVKVPFIRLRWHALRYRYAATLDSLVLWPLMLQG